MMGLHLVKNVIEEADRFHDVRTFVQHHAFGMNAHSSVGDFSARRYAGLSHRLEHLGGPDDRCMGGLAEPEDFFLDFSQPLETDFDSRSPRATMMPTGW